MTAPARSSAAGPPEPAPSTALLTDQYELTMLRSALRSGVAHRRAVFEVFGRRLPEGRRYAVVAGTGRLLQALRHFRFDEPTLRFLLDNDVVDEQTAEWLSTYRFSGNIWGYAEGDCFFPGSPILVVEGTFAEAVLLETLALSIFNHDTAIASAASRMAVAAGERPLIEMGSRRTHEESAVASARAAYLAGFSSTSNLEAGRRYGIPTRGTSAHAFTLVHDSERDAFTAQIEALGAGTTLLVDTYDVRAAVRAAIEVGGTDLGAIRIDSGDLLMLAQEVRRQLDELGATNTRIVVSGDLDEYAIAGLAPAPADAYGVGTSLVVGSGAPTGGLVYKLVARAETADPAAPLVGVAKYSAGKPTHKGRKWAHRELDAAGTAVAEHISTARDIEAPGRDLLRQLVADGEVVCEESLDDARERHRQALAELPPHARQLSRGEPAIPTTYDGSNGAAAGPTGMSGAEPPQRESVGSTDRRPSQGGTRWPTP